VTVHVRLFAILRERAGADHVEVELPERATVADALAALAQLPGLQAVAGGGVRMAVNREYVSNDTLVGPADELALIPPVSGGAATHHLEHVTDRVHAIITPEPLSLDRLLQFVQHRSAGAVVSFQGMPRDVPVLEYEAYTEMALAKLAAILSETIGGHGLIAAAAEHRIGLVPALEASITIAVSAPHRQEAFDGARTALDRIKAEAPIWKVEVTAEGGRSRPRGTLPR
jgi:molybdopterin converting factor subunit 1